MAKPVAITDPEWSLVKVFKPFIGKLDYAKQCAFVRGRAGGPCARPSQAADNLADSTQGII